MSHSKIRVGIIGLNAERGWARDAHLPALRALSNDYSITALCTSRQASADAAARQLGIAHAFSDPAQMASHPDVDLVVVTVKVTEHDRLVRAALEAGKHIFCEWPLAMDAPEAEALLALAEKQGVHHFVGLQSRCSPVLRYVRDLIADGYIGNLRSTSVIASGMVWGAYIDRPNAYIVDARNRATMTTIPFGHFVDAFTHLLGDFKQVSALQGRHYDQVTLIETGELLPKSAPDQLLVQGQLESEAFASIHYRGGSSRQTNLLWEINGTEGDLLISSPMGQMQLAPLTLQGGRAQDTALTELSLPSGYADPAIPTGIPWNVGHLYAEIAGRLRSSQGSPPDFRAALANHRLIERIELAAKAGHRLSSGN